MKYATVKSVEKTWLSSKEAQKYLGMGEDFFRKLRQEAKIHYYRIGRNIIYAKKDIDELVMKNQQL